MKVTEIMVRDVVTVSPEDSLVSAAHIITEKGLEGLPVVDSSGIVLGLLGRANLVAGKGEIYLPTLLAFLTKFDLYRKDKEFVAAELDSMLALKVGDVMNLEPPLLYEGESVDTAIMHLSALHGISPTCIVTASRRLVGVITKRDMFRYYSGEYPDLVEHSVRNSLNDRKVEQFLDTMERRFIFISRWRTKVWFSLNIFFLLLGIIATVFFSVRISVN